MATAFFARLYNYATQTFSEWKEISEAEWKHLDRYPQIDIEAKKVEESS